MTSSFPKKSWQIPGGKIDGRVSGEVETLRSIVLYQNLSGRVALCRIWFIPPLERMQTGSHLEPIQVSKTFRFQDIE